MLSMKSRTSLPSSSRKYSAIVSPVSATRRRAPGGSFICPKTIAILSMTPRSRISPSISVDRVTPDDVLDRSTPIDGLAGHVEETADGAGTYRNGEGRAQIRHGRPAAQPVGRRHGDRANGVVADVLLHLRDHRVAVVVE